MNDVADLDPVIADQDFDTKPRYIRVTDKRHGFVEFDFAIGEPDLHIEMVLPEDDFKSFCDEHNATMLEPGAHQHEKVEDLGFEWRLRDATGRFSRS